VLADEVGVTYAHLCRRLTGQDEYTSRGDVLPVGDYPVMVQSAEDLWA